MSVPSACVQTFWRIGLVAVETVPPVWNRVVGRANVRGNRIHASQVWQLMRILHVFDHSLPLQSGYVSRSLGIIRSQRLRGWQTIHLTTPRHIPTTTDCEIVDGLVFYRTPHVPSKLPGLRELKEMRATRRRLVDIVRREKPDVIHAHSPVLNVLPAILVARQFGLPVVYEVRALWEDAAVDHGTTQERSLRYQLSRMIDSWAMRRVDCVAAICEPLRQEIVARGIASDRVVVVPNCVDSALLSTDVMQPEEGELRRALGLDDGMVLGFIGSFYSYEGLDLLLKAAVRLRQNGLKFSILLVGGGPEEAGLRAQVRELQLDDRVRFAGRVHHSQVARYYRLIDLLVFPRKRMRLTDLVTPLKPLEAMAQCKPILASDVGGHRELIRKGETGYFFPAGDEAVLAATIERLIANPEDLRRVAEQGRRYVAAERTWDRLTEIYASIYAKIKVRP